MRQFLLGLSFSIVFGIGCAAGVATQQQVAEAEAPAGVTRWEYKCVDFRPNKAEKVQSMLNAEGPAGWELVLVEPDVDVCCFKRGLP